jgi:hypothetical protein
MSTREVRIDFQTLGVRTTQRYFFYSDDAVAGTWQELNAELAEILLRSFGWADILRNCLSRVTLFSRVKINEIQPARSPWSDGGFNWGALHGEILFDVRVPSDFTVIRWHAGLEGLSYGWTLFGPCDWVSLNEGTISSAFKAQVESFCGNHITPKIGLLGNTYRGCVWGTGPLPRPIISYSVNPFTSVRLSRKPST